MNRWLWAMVCSLIIHSGLFLLPSPPITVAEFRHNIKVQLLSPSETEEKYLIKNAKNSRGNRQSGPDIEKKFSRKIEEKTSESQTKSAEVKYKTVKKEKSEIASEKAKAEASDHKKTMLKKRSIIKKVKTVKKVVKEKKAAPLKNHPDTPEIHSQSDTEKQATIKKAEKAGFTGKSSVKAPGETVSIKKGDNSGEKVISEEKVNIISRVAPSYPLISRKRKEEGTVTILLTVKTGKVKSTKVEISSGHDRLDRSAMKALKRWRFDRSVTATVRIPVIFSLKK